MVGDASENKNPINAVVSFNPLETIQTSASVTHYNEHRDCCKNTARNCACDSPNRLTFGMLLNLFTYLLTYLLTYLRAMHRQNRA